MSSAAPAPPPPPDAPLCVEQVRKSFGDVTAVAGVSFHIAKGERLALLGGSGCGKTTLLRMIAGFERPDHGRILIEGRDVTDLPPYERPVNMMFQSYALFPHMTVARNVGFGLVQEGMAKAEIARRVEEALDLVQMGTLAGRRPDQLSGGQRQRVALARAIVKRPTLLLLDEPMAALDRKLREQTRLELVELQRRLGIAFVIVTHDQDEAMTMATTVAVMDSGSIVQMDTPSAIYERPSRRFVAEFIGGANVLEGDIVAAVTDRPSTTPIAVRCPSVGADIVAPTFQGARPGTRIWLALRAERIALSHDKPGEADNAVPGTVRDIAYLGDHSIYHVATPGGLTMQVSLSNRAIAARPKPGDSVWLGWSVDDAVTMRG